MLLPHPLSGSCRELRAGMSLLIVYPLWYLTGVSLLPGVPTKLCKHNKTQTKLSFGIHLKKGGGNTIFWFLAYCLYLFLILKTVCLWLCLYPSIKDFLPFICLHLSLFALFSGLLLSPSQRDFKSLFSVSYW